VGAEPDALSGPDGPASADRPAGDGPDRPVGENGGAPGRPNLVERSIRRFDRFQQRHRMLAVPWAVLQKFGNDQGGAKAALMAYYGLFALFPMLLLFTTILGFVLSGDEALRHRLIDSALGDFPVIGPQLKSSAHPLEGSGVALAIGILGTLYGTLGLGQSSQNALNSIWNIPYVRWPSFYFRWARAVGLIALLGLAVLASTALTAFATAVTHGSEATVLAIAGSAVINFGLFMLAYMLMSADHLSARTVVAGAVFATVFWETLQIVGSWYVTRSLQHASPTYGVFAVIIALVSWIYLGSHAFLLAAEINVVLFCRLWPRSITQPPLIAGDRKTFERLAAMEVRRPEMEVRVVFPPAADRDPLDEPAEVESPRSLPEPPGTG
jgi:YihY family inner membrane protein